MNQQCPQRSHLYRSGTVFDATPRQGSVDRIPNGIANLPGREFVRFGIPYLNGIQSHGDLEWLVVFGARNDVSVSVLYRGHM